MATIKSFTDISQSKTLSKILPLESADMCYMYLGAKDKEYQDFPICAPAMEGDLCAWSLAALLVVLPEVSLNTFKDGKWNAMVRHDDKMIYEDKDNPVDACYELILKLHALNLL